MRGLERMAISMVSLLLLTGQGYKATECKSDVVVFPDKPTPHTVDVVLTWNAALDECVATTPKPGDSSYEVRTSKMGDTITWRIVNLCREDITVGISSFRPARKDTAGRPEAIEHPLEVASDSLTVKAIKGGSAATFTAKTKATINHYGRPCATTYLYDLEQVNADRTRRVIQDPQIEVPK